MSISQTLIAYGSYTSDGAARNIVLPGTIAKFEVTNRTDYGQSPAGIVYSWWQRPMANNSAFQSTESGAGVLSANATTTNGIALIATPAVPEAAIAVTAITAATPAVASTGTTPSVGDIVRVYGTTGMLQVASMDFSVTAVAAGVSMTFGYLAAAGFAAPATAGSYRRVSDLKYYPRRRFITGITAATSAVITLSVTHGYVVDEYITVYVPTGFGMTEMNGLTGRITAINTTTNTITTDIDSSAFTAFAFPTSAVAAGGVTFPHTVPAGEFATILTQATDDRGDIVIRLGTDVVGANGKVMDWVAYGGELIS